VKLDLKIDDILHEIVLQKSAPTIICSVYWPMGHPIILMEIRNI